MSTSVKLPATVVAAIDRGRCIRIRAGMEPHRFIAIWAVVVKGRVFVRAYYLKERSWWRTFLEDPRGAIQIGARTMRVRAVQTRSESLKDAVSRAYLEKYGDVRNLKYAKGMGRGKSRETTTELVAWQSGKGEAGGLDR